MKPLQIVAFYITKDKSKSLAQQMFLMVCLSVVGRLSHAQNYPFTLPAEVSATQNVNSLETEEFNNKIIGYNIFEFQDSKDKVFIRKFDPITIRFPHGVWTNFYNWETDGYTCFNDTLYNNDPHSSVILNYIKYNEPSSEAEMLPAHTPEIPEYIPGVTNRSKLFTKFSYPGDSPAMLRTTMDWGKKAYMDLDYNYTVIPSYLRGAEYIRTPNSDRGYWARDQLQFVAGADMDIYVGHDDRVSCPEFLRLDYHDTGDDINLGGVAMSVFKREAMAGESIIMAGNSDGSIPEDCRMYVVIGKKR